MNTVVEPDFTIERFAAGDIDPESFDHEAHVYVAWLHVREYELSDAIGRFDAGLKRLVVKLNAVGKYHATLTWFYMLLIADRANAEEPWQVFRCQNADLFKSSKTVLSRYYSDEFLFSDRARQRFLLPNKLLNS